MARKYEGTIDRYFVFCRMAQVASGNALAAVWDFCTGGGDTFNKGVRLSVSGQEPATHIGVGTITDLGMKQGIEDAVVTGTPWLQAFKKSDGYTFESACAAHPDGPLLVIEEIA
jgi:hypothetical protein